MKLKLQTQGFTASNELTKLLYKKVARLTQLPEKITAAEVKLSCDESGSNENKVCNIRLAVPGNDLLANVKSKTFEDAIADAVEVLKRKIEKRKTRIDILK